MPALSTKMASLPPLSRSFSSEIHVPQDGFRCLSSAPSNFSRRSLSALPANERATMNASFYLLREGNHGRRYEFFHTRCEARNMLSGCDETRSSKEEMSCPIWYASESDSSEKHQRSLETYIQKLHSQAKQTPLVPESDITKIDGRSSQAREGLRSLETYFGTLKEDVNSEPTISGTSTLNVSQDFSIGNTESSQTKQQKGISGPRHKRTNIYAGKSASSLVYDEKETGNLYMISMLLAINIAVFFFEIASPVKGSNDDLYSLPLMYGAKVNDLIMVGEWWRLLTPMFLHSGLLHIALSSWVLLSFGPQVSKGYGTFTFLLIYILGGVSGNFTSFLHTSETTVGGSGPEFAVIGAWLIYQLQNKDVTEKEPSDSMFQKAIIATALSFVLANFGPIDNWTNLGAAVSGIAYGYFTCPVLQVEDASSDSMQEKIKEEITLIRQPANTFKSLVIFTLFLSILSSLLFLMESPMGNLELEELIQIVD